MDHPEKTSEVIETLLIWLVGRGRILILSVVLFVTLVIAGFAAQVPIESNNSSMVSKSKDLQDNYDTFRKTFGNDEVLLAISHPQLLHAEGLQLLEHTTNDLGALKGATRVLSITNAERLAAGTLGTEADHIAAHSARSEGDYPDFSCDSRGCAAAHVSTAFWSAAAARRHGDQPLLDNRHLHLLRVCAQHHHGTVTAGDHGSFLLHRGSYVQWLAGFPPLFRRAVSELRAHPSAAKDKKSDNHYLQLLIEFVLEDRGGSFTLYAPTLTREGEALSLLQITLEGSR